MCSSSFTLSFPIALINLFRMAVTEETASLLDVFMVTSSISSSMLIPHNSPDELECDPGGVVFFSVVRPKPQEVHIEFDHVETRKE